MTEQETNTLTGPELLKAYEDNWQTAMGAWFPGERVVLRGKDVFTELNDCSWMEYIVYAVTGKKNPKLAKIIEGLSLLSTSYPDPRLWNNRIAALAGTSRSTGALALSAGIAASEATIYGLKPIIGALDFLYRAVEKKSTGISIEAIVKEELKANRCISGYGRPLTNVDERIAPALRFLSTIEADDGDFLKLAFEIENYLKGSRYKYRMNIAAISAATAADLGVTVDEYYYTNTLAFIGGILPCHLDAKNKPEGTFYPLAVDRINSTATANRTWAN
ncbi:MAG: hypothetical protein KBT88_05160 [Gammaproteobacteria bacterium]|nr:hypothetical protein [Gammaproteobacteria bacterium]MBQ0839157.1 hypothetical protein [Gammaproteobacteria bacterium]